MGKGLTKAFFCVIIDSESEGNAMKWNVKLWYNVEIHYIDLFDRCRTINRDFETKPERQGFINDYLNREREGIIQKVTAVDIHDIEIWERA